VEQEDYRIEEVLVGEEGRPNVNEDAEGGGADGELRVEGEAMDGAADDDAVRAFLLFPLLRALDCVLVCPLAHGSSGALLMQVCIACFRRRRGARRWIESMRILETCTCSWSVPQAIPHLQRCIHRTIRSYKL
jgi:hypothetical protein